MKAIFSNNLMRFRIAKNYTQEQVAEVLGVSAQTVSRWECNITLPDVAMLPDIARLYCVTIDDFYQETSVAYDNYAQRLLGVYEASRNPEDFVRADFEFKKLINSNLHTTRDIRLYGALHLDMMQYCSKKAEKIFDEILEQGITDDENVYWQTKRQKLYFYTQIGRGEEGIRKQLAIIETGSKNVHEWECLVAAYFWNKQYQKAFEWFGKAIKAFPEEKARKCKERFNL